MNIPLIFLAIIGIVCVILFVIGIIFNKKPNIESEEFYNLMQNYRHAQVSDQKQVSETYNEVIDYINKFYK